MPVCRINLGLIYTVQHLQKLYLYGTSSITSLWKPFTYAVLKATMLLSCGNFLQTLYHLNQPYLAWAAELRRLLSPLGVPLLHSFSKSKWTPHRAWSGVVLLSSWGDEVVLEGEVQPASNITNYEF